jgi:hypothetical protein
MSAVGKADYSLKAWQAWNLFRFDHDGYIYPFGTLPNEWSKHTMVGRFLREPIAPVSSPSSLVPPTALSKKCSRLTEICLDDDQITNDL